MAEPLFRIRPLEWKYKAHIGQWVAVGICATYRASLYEFGAYLSIKCVTRNFPSLEAAQAAANEHNRQCLLPGLEEVKTINFYGNCTTCNGPLLAALNGLWCDTCRVETNYGKVRA